jgi:outer membrane protein assembly factor BamB
MRLVTRASRGVPFAVLTILLAATATQAAITKLTPLAEVLESDQYIFVAKAEKLDPGNKDRPTATFKLDKKLKGSPPFERIPVNMTGDDEGKKAGDTKTIFERLDTSRELVFFVRKQGTIFNAKVFVEGSWFSIYGTLDSDGKTIRWALLHGEPFLRRTFKGTSAELVKTIEDAVAKKAKPPEPNEKEKPGYGPVIEKKNCSVPATHPSTTGGPLFAVIPSFVLVGPLAIVAALFPGVFARLAVGMKRWRAFLVVASINSTVALVYWAVFLKYFPELLPSTRWLAPDAVTAYLVAVTLVGMVWAGRRYRHLAAEDPSVTDTPRRTELLALAGLSAFLAVCTVLTAVVAERWSAVFEMPFRELTYIGIGLAAATLYAAYRAATESSDSFPLSSESPVRLSLSGESVGLCVVVLCGLAGIVLGSRTSSAPGGTESGTADANFGPRLVGEPVALEVYEVEDGKNVPEVGRVWSGLTLDGDRIYFGMDTGGGGAGAGRMLGVNRHTGKLEWAFDAPGMHKVYCSPTVAGGRIYCGEGEHENKGCRLFCVNVSDRSSAWHEPFKTGSHTEGAPAVADGKVYFPAGDDGLYCCDANTGAKIWQWAGGKAAGIHIDGPPAVANGTVFVGSGLYTYAAAALDGATGAEKWRTDLQLRSFGAPTVRAGKVFYGVGTGNMGEDTYYYPEEGVKETAPAGAVVCLDGATGKEEWRYPLPKSVHTGVAVDAFSAYVGCRDGSVYALDRKTGVLRWKTNIGLSVLGCPAIAASGGFPMAVYAVSEEGLMVCLNPQTGMANWQKPLPGFRLPAAPEPGVMCSPVVVSTQTPTGSTRTIYVGAMTIDPKNRVRKTVAVFKFDDAIGE